MAVQLLSREGRAFAVLGLRKSILAASGEETGGDGGWGKAGLQGHLGRFNG
jgi:hypothetical protein